MFQLRDGPIGRDAKSDQNLMNSPIKVLSVLDMLKKHLNPTHFPHPLLSCVGRDSPEIIFECYNPNFLKSDFRFMAHCTVSLQGVFWTLSFTGNNLAKVDQGIALAPRSGDNETFWFE